MGLLFTAFAGFLFAAAGVTDGAARRIAEPADLVFARAEEDAVRKGEALRRVLGDGESGFEVDLETGTIRFTTATKAISAPIQVVGTYNTLDGTFLWGWDHPSVPAPLAADARLARAFGRHHDLELFTTRKVECTEDEAWLFTAVALYLSGAESSYRAPYGTTLVFLTLGKVSIAPVE